MALPEFHCTDIAWTTAQRIDRGRKAQLPGDLLGTEIGQVRGSHGAREGRADGREIWEGEVSGVVMGC